MIIRRKPTGVILRRKPIGSVGQRLLQRSAAQVRRMVISRMPQRGPVEDEPMVWNRDFGNDEWQGEAEAPPYFAENFAEPTPDWSQTARVPNRRPAPTATPSVQAQPEDEPMPTDLQAIFNLHKAMGRVTNESFLGRDREAPQQPALKVPPSAKPVQSSGRYEPPPQRPVVQRNAPPTPETEPPDPEPAPVQRRVMSKVEYVGVRNMGEEMGLPQANDEADFDDSADNFDDDLPDALPGTFEDEDNSAGDFADGFSDAAYDENVSAAIARAESPTSGPVASVQSSPADAPIDDPQQEQDTFMQSQATMLDSAPELAPAFSANPTSTSAPTPSMPSSVIEEGDDLQRRPIESSIQRETDDSRAPYTPEQLGTAIADAETFVSTPDPVSQPVVRATRIETPVEERSPLSTQEPIQPVVHSRIVDEVLDDTPDYASPPLFERRVEGQALIGTERPRANVQPSYLDEGDFYEGDYAEFDSTDEANYSSAIWTSQSAFAPDIPDIPSLRGVSSGPNIPAVPSGPFGSPPVSASPAPTGRVAREFDDEIADEVNDPETGSVQRSIDPAQPSSRYSTTFETDDAIPLPTQSMDLGSALRESGMFSEPNREGPAPVLMPPIGRARHRPDSPPPQPSYSSAPSYPSAPPSASMAPVQRSSDPVSVQSAIQRAESPETTYVQRASEYDSPNNSTEQNLLTLLDMPADTLIQRSGAPMPSVNIAPSVMDAPNAIQRADETAPSSPNTAPSGGEEKGDDEGANKEEVEKMATEVYRLLHRRLKVERERRSR